MVAAPLSAPGSADRSSRSRVARPPRARPATTLVRPWPGAPRSGLHRRATVPKPTPDEAQPSRPDRTTPSRAGAQRTVLELLADRTGHAPKVFLTDSGSEHGASPVVDPGSAAMKLVPQGRGNYQLLGEIARGGMGVILKGHDTDLGRDVAVKVLDKELSQNPAVVQRFVEEAQIGGQLQHPGIVPVYELGLMADDCPYFTMKLVKGRTLAALLKQRKSPADGRGRLLAIFESVCQTVAYAHSKGVLHRDLKPANIMVGAFGEVQVVDWGLAKVLHRGGVADERRAKETLHTVIETVRSGPGSSGSDSLVGSVMGTPAYMAPEQAQGEVEKLDERADVFSLGAILCELLSGHPPYEEGEGRDSLVVQAAKAQLDPARARLEACEADPALVRVCLDCLMPARAARPANAEEVAKAVHAFLSSVEERAQKAELAAIEARIKAAEERRARRLTLALAATIVAALALGGGAYSWFQRERAQRVAQLHAAVEAAQGESIELGQAGRTSEALEAARRALALTETGEADAALRERAQRFVAQAELAVGAAERERELLRQDETLRARLVDLRLEQIETIGNPKREAELDQDFAQAFHDYGVDLEAADLVPALERIRARDIAEEVALALDDWGRVRRRVRGASSEEAKNLFYLAMDLDEDPERKRMREAIFENELATMLELAAPESLAKLAPGSIFVLGATLWDRFPERRPDVYRMFDQALHLYPSDFVLQWVGGNIYQEAGRFQAALACRVAALSLRPGNMSARLRVSESLLFLGRVTDSEGAARACVAAAPNNADAHYALAMARIQLGDFTGALTSVTRALELRDEPNWRSDELVLRYYQGQATRAEVLEALARTNSPEIAGTYAYGLLDHPDPAQRDPEFVLRTLATRPSLFGGADWVFVLDTIARMRLEDWSGARTALGSHYETPTLALLSPGALIFLRALVYAQVGLEEAARECHARGMVEWKSQTGGNPAAWEHSDMMRWRREAETALAR